MRSSEVVDRKSDGYHRADGIQPSTVPHVAHAVMRSLQRRGRFAHVIGRGCGRLLLERAVVVAAAEGMTVLRITADPYARPFYERAGARLVGHVSSTVIPGRVLPRLELGRAGGRTRLGSPLVRRWRQPRG